MAGRFALLQRPYHSCGNVVGSIPNVRELCTHRLRIIGAQKGSRRFKGKAAHIQAEFFTEDIGNAMRFESGIFLGIVLGAPGKLRLRQRLGKTAEQVIGRQAAAISCGR